MSGVSMTIYSNSRRSGSHRRGRRRHGPNAPSPARRAWPIRIRPRPAGRPVPTDRQAPGPLSPMEILTAFDSGQPRGSR
jgi:hypothetical protein